VKPIPVPERIHRSDHEIVIRWSEQHQSVYPARYLRQHCHCAGCREELTGRPILDPVSVPDDVRANRLSLVGGYAVQIAWSDGHSTGIYSFEYLSAICPCERCDRERSGRPSAEV